MLSSGLEHLNLIPALRKTACLERFNRRQVLFHHISALQLSDGRFPDPRAVPRPPAGSRGECRPLPCALGIEMHDYLTRTHKVVTCRLTLTALGFEGCHLSNGTSGNAPVCPSSGRPQAARGRPRTGAQAYSDTAYSCQAAGPQTAAGCLRFSHIFG